MEAGGGKPEYLATQAFTGTIVAPGFDISQYYELWIIFLSATVTGTTGRFVANTSAGAVELIYMEADNACHLLEVGPHLILSSNRMGQYATDCLSGPLSMGDITGFTTGTSAVTVVAAFYGRKR